jgi:isopentenyl-diphosphate delta-isomerase
MRSTPGSRHKKDRTILTCLFIIPFKVETTKFTLLALRGYFLRGSHVSSDATVQIFFQLSINRVEALIEKPRATEESTTIGRKQSHVELCVSESVSFRTTKPGFDGLRFEHNALPEIAFDEIETSCTLFGKTLQAPILISSMTGGYDKALDINRNLAQLANDYGLAMGIGSARQALENSDHHDSFRIVRKTAPNAIIFTNIGAHEVGALSRAGNISPIRKIIELVEADALAIHLNPLQELMQPEGSTDFRNVLQGISACVKELGVPVVIKEVGAGISQSVARRLLEVGVKAIDVSGAGGTSWAGVEILRHATHEQSALDPFWDWGIPTVQALSDVSELRGEFGFVLIASGGVRNGLDIAKSIALGAELAGIARPLISALETGGEAALRSLMDILLFQLKGAMFLTGSRNLAELSAQLLFTSA